MIPDHLRTDFFDYDLPADLIASHPLERRDASRMMVVRRGSKAIEHQAFVKFPELCGSRLPVFNNTRVARARFFSNDGKIEVLRLDAVDPFRWRCMVKPGRKMREGAVVEIGPSKGVVESIFENGDRCIVFGRAVDESLGHLALPHYMGREDEADDLERYQTVYSDRTREKAIAAPTAGLHFTPEIMARLDAAFVTLDVGVGTFQPVKAECLTDHVMHRERYEISAANAEKIRSAQQTGREILAVGTTVARVLEHVARLPGEMRARSGETDIFLYPGAEFCSVGALLTNFHLPKSTLFMLVCAFAGTDLMKAAYAEAVREAYRFYSYGDCMLIL